MLPEGATTTSTSRSNRWAAALLALAVALLLAPTGAELARTPDWLAHPSRGGFGYTLGHHGVVFADLDPTATAATLATLALWRDGAGEEGEVWAELMAQGFDYRLASFAEVAAERGFPGHWASVDGSALAPLSTPFLAHLLDGGGRFVIVLRVAGGYLYLSDPNAGTLLVPLAEFTARSSEQYFLFNDPIALPGVW